MTRQEWRLLAGGEYVRTSNSRGIDRAEQFKDAQNKALEVNISIREVNTDETHGSAPTRTLGLPRSSTTYKAKGSDTYRHVKKGNRRLTAS